MTELRELKIRLVKLEARIKQCELKITGELPVSFQRAKKKHGAQSKKNDAASGKR